MSTGQRSERTIQRLRQARRRDIREVVFTEEDIYDA